MMSGVPLETCLAFNKVWNNTFYYKLHLVGISTESLTFLTLNIIYQNLETLPVTLQDSKGRFTRGQKGGKASEQVTCCK